MTSLPFAVPVAVTSPARVVTAAFAVLENPTELAVIIAKIEITEVIFFSNLFK